MSELKAEDYYNKMKEIVEVPDFTKLTSTGISQITKVYLILQKLILMHEWKQMV